MARRIIAILLIAIILLVLLLYGSNNRVEGDLRAVRIRQLGAQAQQVAGDIDRLLQLRMVQVFTLAALPSLRGYAASDSVARLDRAPVAQTELQAIVAADPMVRSASIVDSTGRVIMTMDESMNEDWSDRAFVQQSLQGHLYASPPSRDYGEISQYYSSPVLDNAGQVAGVLVVRVAVQELWNSVSIPNTIVIDTNRVRVVDTSAAPMPFASVVPLKPDALARLVNGHEYGSEITQIRSTSWNELSTALDRHSKELAFRDSSGRMAVGSLRQTGTNDWSVISFDYDENLVAQAREILLANVAVALVAFLAGIGVAGVGRRVIAQETTSR